MTKSGPETRLVARMRTAILKEWPAAWIVKVHGSPYQPAGISDLLVVVDGQLTGIEVKDPKRESEEQILKRVTPLQWKNIRDLKAAGATAGVAWTIEQALDLIESSLL